MKKIFFYLGIAAITAMHFVAVAHAADIAVSPAVIDDHGLPQDIFNYTVTITNTTDHQINVFASVYELTAKGDQPFTDPSTSDRPVLLADWMNVPRGAMTLQAGQSEQVPVGVTINPYATAGEYHAVIAFVEGGTRDEAEQNLNGAPQTLVDFTVASNAKEVLALSDFSTAKRFYSAFPVDISYNITNNGNVPSTPAGSVFFYDKDGHEIGSVPANPDNVTIPAGAVQKFNEAWNGGTGVGMGEYKASLEMSYGADDSQLADTVVLWVLPWEKLLIIFIILFVFVIILALLMHRSYLRSHRRRMQLIEHLTKKRHVVDLRNPYHGAPPRPPQPAPPPRPKHL